MKSAIAAGLVLAAGAASGAGIPDHACALVDIVTVERLAGEQMVKGAPGMPHQGTTCFWSGASQDSHRFIMLVLEPFPAGPSGLSSCQARADAGAHGRKLLPLAGLADWAVWDGEALWASKRGACITAFLGNVFFLPRSPDDQYVNGVRRVKSRNVGELARTREFA